MTTNPKHLAIDLDDVVLDFVGNLVSVLNREYNAGLSQEDIQQWDLRKSLDKVVGQNWWKWWQERDWLWAQAQAVPGAIGALRTLRRKGYWLEIVTSKPQWAEAQTWRWLGKWRPPVQQVTVIDMKQQKFEVSPASLLIDDKPENCAGFVTAGREAFLFSRPHNQGTSVAIAEAYKQTGQRTIRVDNWSDVLKELALREERHG